MESNIDNKIYNVSEKFEDVRSKYRIYCKCGHSMVFFPYEKETRKLCTYCGHFVYKNKEEEFYTKMKQELFKIGGVYQ